MYFLRATNVAHGPPGPCGCASLDAHLILVADDLQRYTSFQLEIITP
jgi:hypothetical protein